MSESKQVIIIGAGFGGLNAARTLGNQKGIRVTVIDRRNHHLFQPLLYQVAIAALSPADIATPIRAVLSPYRNVTVLLGNVHRVDAKARVVHTEHGPISYDYLILACGSRHSYFGREEWEDRAPGLKSIEEATEIRRRVLMAFEMAELEKDPEQQKKLLNFVIIGGGPTGVELAGAIGEIAHFTLAQDFRNIDPKKTNVILLEGGPRVLPAFHPKLSAKAERSLKKLNISVRTGSRVSQIDRKGVYIGDQFIPTATVIWAAGVEPESINKNLDIPLAKNGRVLVEADLSTKEQPNIFVVGDQAHFSTGGDTALPGLAPVAIQMGSHSAKNIIRELKGKNRKAFRYIDKGMMATIGRGTAVLEVSKFRMSGLLAWLAWLFVHILYLVGFRNRWSVFAQWCWSYFTLSRGTRLITSRNWSTDKRFELTKRYLEIVRDTDKSE